MVAITSFLCLWSVEIVVHAAIVASHQWKTVVDHSVVAPSFAPTISSSSKSSPSSLPLSARSNGRPPAKKVSKRKKRKNMVLNTDDSTDKYPIIPKRKRKIRKVKRSTLQTDESGLSMEREHRQIVLKTKKKRRTRASTHDATIVDIDKSVDGSRKIRAKKGVKGRRRKKSQHSASLLSYNGEGRIKSKNRRKVIVRKGETDRSTKAFVNTDVRKKTTKKKKKRKQIKEGANIVGNDRDSAPRNEAISKDLVDSTNDPNDGQWTDTSTDAVLNSIHPNTTQITLPVSENSAPSSIKSTATTDEDYIPSSHIHQEVPIFTQQNDEHEVVTQSSNILPVHSKDATVADVEINTEYLHLSNQSTTTDEGIAEVMTSRDVDVAPNRTSMATLSSDELQNSNISYNEDAYDTVEWTDVDLNQSGTPSSSDDKLPALSIVPNIDDIHFINATDIVTITPKEEVLSSSLYNTSEANLNDHTESPAESVTFDSACDKPEVPLGGGMHSETEATIRYSTTSNDSKTDDQGYTTITGVDEESLSPLEGTNAYLQTKNTSNEVVTSVLSTFNDDETESVKGNFEDQAKMIEQNVVNTSKLDVDTSIRSKDNLGVDEEDDEDASDDDDDDDDDDTDEGNADDSLSETQIQDQGENKNHSLKDAAQTSSDFESSIATTEPMPPSLAPVQNIEDVSETLNDESETIESSLPVSTDFFDENVSVVDDVVVDPIKDDNHLTVSIVTWNLAEESPSEEDALFLKRFRNNGKDTAYGSDLILISGQECENIKPRRSEGSRSREFRRLMIMMLGKNYVPLALHLLGGIQFGLFCKRSILGDIEQASVADVTCGIGNVFHNKGAIGCFLKVKSKDTTADNPRMPLDRSVRMLFVTAHMAAHVKNTEARDLDFWRIVRELELQAPAHFLSRKNPVTETTGKFLLDFTDRIFFCGDLNYRIDLPREEVEYTITRIRTLMESKALESLSQAKELREQLFAYDQLRETIALERAFPGFAEGRITFDPTFKFDKGTGEYDSSHKQRIPAWTDRVLYKPIGTHILEYDSVTKAQHSDHRPVFATFLVDRRGRVLEGTKRRKRSSTKKRNKRF